VRVSKITSHNTQYQQHQPFSQQHSNVGPGQGLGNDPLADLAAYFAAQPQISSAPYQQQPQRVFGQLVFPPGLSVIVLDDAFRAAAEKSPMIMSFVKSVDLMAERNGIAGQQEQVREQTRGRD
jgi:hypothetical protein